uniref:Cytoskeleton associated protein 2-like n=1 Tax=Seriola lalandi dorsalis TaxID=1841481 RepID=A0A3B4YSQ0_SERLL
MDTVVSSKSTLNATSQLKKPPNTGLLSSGRASSNAASNTKFSSNSNSAWSGPRKTVSVRMSLGPIVKTKTGLIPAVTQSRNTKSRVTHTPAAAANTTTTSVGNKVRSSTSSLVSDSQSSATAQRKTLRNTALNNPVNERTVSSTARAGIKVQSQDKSNSKPLLGTHSQSSCKSQLSSHGWKPVPTSKCIEALIKPKGREGMSKTNRSTGEPTDRPTKQKSEGGGEKNGKSCKVPSRTSYDAVSRRTSKAVSGQFTRAAVAELGGKTKTCKETQSKKAHSSANAPPPQTCIKRTGAPVMSQTVPQPYRTISLTGQATNMKTPKVSVRIIPQTEGKKMTAAQEERIKLQEWREAKGISYKRPPMPVKPQVRRTVAAPQPFWTSMKEEDETHSLICAVDRSLADCIKLLGEGCPSEQVREVLLRLPAVSQKFAKYWICQARLMEQEGNLDVLPMFEEAVRVVLEVRQKICKAIFKNVLKSKYYGEDGWYMSPAFFRGWVILKNDDLFCLYFSFSGPQSQQREPARVNGQEVRFFTPVRRSVRIERASLRYPASLQDHDLCVTSYNDLISKEVEENNEEQEPLFFESIFSWSL